MVWFNIIPGLNFNFLSFTLIIVHYHNQKLRKIEFKPNIKLNHNRIKKNHNFQYDWYVHVPCNKLSTFRYFKFEAHNLKKSSTLGSSLLHYFRHPSNIIKCSSWHTCTHNVVVNLIFGLNVTLFCF